MIILIIIIAILFLGFSARWNWWRRPYKGLALLMYHKIGTPPKDSKIKNLWVSEKKFAKQMAYLKKHNYQIITFLQFLDIIQQNIPLSNKTVIITFDDGYKNNYELALPILKEFDFKACFFIVTSTVGDINKWHNPATEKNLPMMTWDQIKTLQEYGMEIGSHTLRHPNLLNIDYKQAETEIKESKKILEEKLQQEIVAFAYPYGAGAYDEKIKALVKDNGYEVAVGIRQAKNVLGEDLSALKRITVRGDENMFDFYLQLTRGRNRL